MLLNGNIEQVFELVKENDEKVFTSEYDDLYFTFLGLVDDVYERCQYGSEFEFIDDIYKEMVEDIFEVDFDYDELEDFTCDLTKEEVYKWLDEHWSDFNFIEVTMEDVEEWKKYFYKVIAERINEGFSELGQTVFKYKSYEYGDREICDFILSEMFEEEKLNELLEGCVFEERGCNVWSAEGYIEVSPL